MTESPSPPTMFFSRHTKRRAFIAGLGSAAAWPVLAQAQQPAMPVVGYLSSRSAEAEAPMIAAVQQGLNATGYVENRNVKIEFRFADGELAHVSLFRPEADR